MSLSLEITPGPPPYGLVLSWGPEGEYRLSSGALWLTREVALEARAALLEEISRGSVTLWGQREALGLMSHGACLAFFGWCFPSITAQERLLVELEAQSQPYEDSDLYSLTTVSDTVGLWHLALQAESRPIRLSTVGHEYVLESTARDSALRIAAAFAHVPPWYEIVWGLHGFGLVCPPCSDLTSLGHTLPEALTIARALAGFHGNLLPPEASVNPSRSRYDREI